MAGDTWPARLHWHRLMASGVLARPFTVQEVKRVFGPLKPYSPAAGEGAMALSATWAEQIKSAAAINPEHTT